jgi:hypothetical protein
MSPVDGYNSCKLSHFFSLHFSVPDSRLDSEQFHFQMLVTTSKESVNIFKLKA